MEVLKKSKWKFLMAFAIKRRLQTQHSNKNYKNKNIKDANTIQKQKHKKMQENCGALRTFSQGYTPAAEQNRRTCHR